jgi:hypothetical protein
VVQPKRAAALLDPLFGSTSLSTTTDLVNFHLLISESIESSLVAAVQDQTRSTEQLSLQLFSLHNVESLFWNVSLRPFLHPSLYGPLLGTCADSDELYVGRKGRVKRLSYMQYRCLSCRLESLKACWDAHGKSRDSALSRAKVEMFTPTFAGRFGITKEERCSSLLIMLANLSSFFSYRSGRFRGASSKTSGQPKSPARSNFGQGASPSPTPSLHTSQSSSSLQAPRVPPPQASPSLSQTLSFDGPDPEAVANGDVLAAYNLPRPKPVWLNSAYAKHIVKGNFMTLSARPKTVEPGEWIAHQGMKLSMLLSIT